MYNPAQNLPEHVAARLNSPANQYAAQGHGLAPLYASKSKAGAVALYSDTDRTVLVAHYPSHFKTKPRKGSKSAYINCVKRSLVWA